MTNAIIAAIIAAIIITILIIGYVKGKFFKYETIHESNSEPLDYSLIKPILLPLCDVETITEFIGGKLYQTTNYYCYECIYAETLQLPFQYKGKIFTYITNYGDDRNAITFNGKNFIIVGRKLVKSNNKKKIA